MKALIRPVLDYGHCVWNTKLDKNLGDKRKIEQVQRRATKLIPSIHNLTYTERLKKLKMHSLLYRRRRGDMIQVFKILNKIDYIDR